MLNQGICTFTGEKMILKNNKNLEVIRSFEEFYEWYQSELVHFLDLGVKATNIFDANYKDNFPTPFLSSFMEGCLEKGGDVTAGTTVYNFSSANAIGMANVVDSLAAIKKIVFEDKTMTLSKLSEIILNNFEGSEKLRKELILKYPKFGNDKNETDILMKELTNIFCSYVNRSSNPRKGRFQSGFYSVGSHAVMGKLTGSLPDGRVRGTSLSNGLSPVQGADILGPTSVIKSVTKLDHRLFGNGMVLDLKFHPAFFENNKHRQAFEYLVKTYFDLGGLEIQFNVVSRETLLNAQKSPEEYRDLIVRVSGFSAYFITLDKVLQDEIIARTEYSII
jgi:formate C-acetyltransferase